MNGYPLDQLYEEMAFIAYHFHWSHDELMNAEHGERQTCGGERKVAENAV